MYIMKEIEGVDRMEGRSSEGVDGAKTVSSEDTDPDADIFGAKGFSHQPDGSWLMIMRYKKRHIVR